MHYVMTWASFLLIADASSSLAKSTVVQSTLSGQASLGEFKLMADSDDVELGNVINSRREDTTLEAIFEELAGASHFKAM